MVLAKGITSGYLPLGATVVTEEIFDAFRGEPGDGREFAQVCTYGGHPACCAAALANIDILTGERLWERASEVGSHLLEALKGLSSPAVGEVRGLGLMIAVELVDGSGAPARRRAAPPRSRAPCGSKGSLVGQMSHAVQGPNSVLTLSPPLVLGLEEADRIVQAFERALPG